MPAFNNEVAGSAVARRRRHDPMEYGAHGATATSAPSSCSARWSSRVVLAARWRCSSSSSSRRGRRSPTTGSPGSAAGGNVDDQLQAIFTSGDLRREARLHVPRLAADLEHAADHRRSRCAIAFVCVAVRLGLHRRVRARVDAHILQPVVRLLASVPSVIYGLLGVLVLVPFIGNHLISERSKASVADVISLSGYSLLAAVLILTVMIAPLMIAIFSDGLRAVPRGWLEGSLGARHQPLAHVLEDRRAHRAAGARRRHRARDRPRARRGGDARDGLRARSASRRTPPTA